MRVVRLGVLMVAGSMVAANLPAQAWTESGDAPSFPDGAAQVTRGAGSLDTITGGIGGSDLRDSFCIKIVDPANFLATTDPASHPGAGGNFDTRLFLFRPDGSAVLANDDTPPSQSPYLSTLTGVATDGSGFVLSRPGEYSLVIAAYPEDPNDFNNTELFLFTPSDIIAAPNPAAATFRYWDDGPPGTGNYTVALVGVEPCLDSIDVVIGGGSTGVDRLCLGNNDGSFETCMELGSPAGRTPGVAMGFVDGDSFLDVVLARGTETIAETNLVCLGNGTGGFTSCSDVSADLEESMGVALGLVNHDLYLDAVFANLDSENRICLGNGSGGFSSCSNIDSNTDTTGEVMLGFLNFDTHLDTVFSNYGQRNRVCLGFGDGTFSCSDIDTDSNPTLDLVLGLVNDDGWPDVIFTNWFQFNRVCLGDGSGGFSPCTDITAGGDTSTRAAALGDLDQDGDLDVVFADSGSAPSQYPNAVCLGDGTGMFPTCADVSADLDPSYGVALGLVDGDGVLDAVFANDGPDRVCLGNGSGGFVSCSDISSDAFGTIGIALGELGFEGFFIDGFESGDTSAWSSST